MRKTIRKLRHWKQRFNKDAEFIWRRSITWEGKLVAKGDPIPEALANNPTKLRRFWEAHAIELAQFDEPNVLTGQKPEPASTTDEESTEMVTKEGDRKWLVKGVDEVFSSKAKANAKAAEILAEAEAAEKPEDDAWLDGDQSED